MGQCVACYFEPCRCLKKETGTCNRCDFLQAEVDALREAVQHYRREVEREKTKRFQFEKELFSND